jgi:tetratricopeptide (TPR) repeat protein
MLGLNLSRRDEIELMRCIDQQNFDEAVRIMASGLTNTAKDVFNHEMIALCHHWAGRDDMAITSAESALKYDPKSFQSLQLLAYVHAVRGEHELAAHYTRLGLETYEPLPSIPHWVWRVVQSVFWLVGLLVPHFKRVAEKEAPDLNEPYKEWFRGAKKYLEWYEAVYRDPMNPKVH